MLTDRLVELRQQLRLQLHPDEKHHVDTTFPCSGGRRIELDGDVWSYSSSGAVLQPIRDPEKPLRESQSSSVVLPDTALT